MIRDERTPSTKSSFPERARLLAASDEKLLAECDVDRVRGSGPGGQKRNKTASAVRIRHRGTGVASQADDSRSQHANKKRALERLRLQLALDVRESVEVGGYEPPSELAALLARKAPARRTDPAYHQAIAQLLDLFVATGCAVAELAMALGVSTGVASRLLASDGAVLRKANELRAVAGLKALRT